MTAIKMRDDMENERRERFIREQEEQMAAQLGVDTTMIDEHLASKNIKAQTTPSGLRYIIKQKGKGPTATYGQLATMKYSGYLLNGKVFDSGVYTFAVGMEQVIGGWDEIAGKMNVGTRLTVYVPSTLAYGNRRRSEDIMENTVLAFDMELQELRNQ
jgi:FKBP-type peptidyl-prolyl cis-trans isomerase